MEGLIAWSAIRFRIRFPLSMHRRLWSNRGDMANLGYPAADSFFFKLVVNIYIYLYSTDIATKMAKHEF
jgi:hypothetical protein